MKRVAIVGGCRTAFVKAGGSFSQLGMLELSIPVIEACAKRLQAEPEELVFGTVLLNPRLPNLARELVLRSNLPRTTQAQFVSNNCVSGLLAATVVADHILQGRIRLGFAGGVESMSRPALTFNKKAEDLFLELSRARSWQSRMKLLSRWRPRFAMPVPPSPREPSTGLTMGEHCEITTKELQVPRAEQDALALASHKHAATAVDLTNRDVIELKGIARDGLIRAETSLEKLAALPPVFDRTAAGTITAGNASALTDGASVVALCEEAHADSLKLKPLAFLKDYEFSAIDPQAGLLMAPVFAVEKLLRRQGLGFGDIDFFEIHEAFAAQVLATLSVWERGWARFPDLSPLGKIDRSSLNVRGGSLALGHPFAATGARLILSAARLLDDTQKRRALISVCAAGGMGCAMLIERS